MNAIYRSVCLLVVCFPVVSRADVRLDLSTATLTLDDRGVVTALAFPDGTRWPGLKQPVFALETASGTVFPKIVRRDGEILKIEFDDGSAASFQLRQEKGLALFRLVSLSARGPVERFRLFRLDVPEQARLGATLNAGSTDHWAAAVLAAELNVNAYSSWTRASRADRPGCSHEFTRTQQAKAGRFAARFAATSDSRSGGWSVQGKHWSSPLDLTGCKAIRAWVHGDGQNEQLKIQLFDGSGGYRDVYIPINFKGWRLLTLTGSALDTLRYDHVAALYLYYNGLPEGRTVSTLIDQIEAMVERDGRQETLVLEDFEDSDSPFWALPGISLMVSTEKQHGLSPASFAVLVASRSELWKTVERFEKVAGLPCPRLGGVWNKASPAIKRSYLFLTDFHESELDQALALARRGGFAMILLGQESWSRGTGHYEVDRDHFPDGLAGLKRTIDRFHQAGFQVGLHFLGPSIYPPDSYLTPVPDSRLVLGPTTTLAADVDETAVFLPTSDPPSAFPAEDGGYEGAGTVLRIGDELITYQARALTGSTGFSGCRRGHLSTRPARHRKGDRVAHLVRSYGYHMFDMDTSLLREVAGNFARVANTCRIDMIYFDGSERLQGDHWYYNARLHRAFYDALENKDLLLQASSTSHSSWHLIARSASADGHGDLKGYLDERSPGFEDMARDGMPLDIGWYYGYDPNTTLDQYEYILGATIGYDSSMSFQVSPTAAARHPFTATLLDLISRYEKLRLSGRVPEAMKARLRVDPALGGTKTSVDRERLADRRREYHLVGKEGHEVFQRVVYEPWHEVAAGERAEPWTLKVNGGPSRVGLWVHVQPGPWLAPGRAYHATDALMLESFDDLVPYSSNPKAERGLKVIRPGEAGSTSPGVTQMLELVAEDSPEGRHHARYTARSGRDDQAGWSAIGRTFDPPLDLSGYRGLGFWLRGDGRGGLFKLQLGDASGAEDHYIANDFAGWRYQQLVRPERRVIDDAHVRSLTFYYNGLPGKATVVCGIDDVKALKTLDEPAISDPWVEIAGRRITWKGTLKAGQYLILRPSERPTRYGPPLTEPELSPETTKLPALAAGEYSARFGCRGLPQLPVRVRIELQPPERYEILAGKR